MWRAAPHGRIVVRMGGVFRVAVYDSTTGRIDKSPLLGEEQKGGSRYVYTLAAAATVERVLPKPGFAGRMFFVGNDLYVYNGGRQNFNVFH